MTKIPSVEEVVDNFGKQFDELKMKPSKKSMPGLERELLKDFMRKAITADRLALLTELRDSGMLEEKEYSDEGDKQSMKYRNHNELGHNTLARNIKAHLDELINSNRLELDNP